MSNFVSHDQRPDLPDLMMSNGETAVFTVVLALAASELAKTQEQEEWAMWFASRDRIAEGSGIVGFDLSDMPWQEQNFEAEHAFLLEVIDATMAKLRWEVLEETPQEEVLRLNLRAFRRLVMTFDKRCHFSTDSDTWPNGRPQKMQRCPQHNVVLYLDGCIVCHEYFADARSTSESNGQGY